MDDPSIELLKLLAAGGIVAALVMSLVVWSLVWKGIALWKAARVGSKKWFIALLLINTLGILEIIYIYIVAGKRRKT